MAVDQSHPYFRYPAQLEASLDDLHQRLKPGVGQRGAVGQFTSTAGGFQGHVVMRDGIVGVWADRDPAGRVTTVVFFHVRGGQVSIHELSDISWTDSDVVDNATTWFDQLSVR